VKTTVLIEGGAAVFLLVFFLLDGVPIEKAFYFSIFHSISAFCNAGFSTFTNNLVNVPGGPMITFICSLLIILGGIGFPVLNLLSDPNKPLRKKIRGMLNNEHASMVIRASIILIVGGTLLLFFTEFNHSMANFTFPSRMFHSYFQSVTARTAGFNSVDMTQIGTASAVIFIVLMFIGASPGSTGGGVKTTTFSILVLSIFSLVKGNTNVIYKRKSVPADLFIKAACLAFVSLAGVSACIFILTLTEPFLVVQIAFEVVSAFGTVGLSLGITPQLSYVGKIVIIFTMFAGRVGPLSFIMVMKKRFAEAEPQFPKGNWIIG
jgi:trk system potassium uptake protein TrkH